MSVFFLIGGGACLAAFLYVGFSEAAMRRHSAETANVRRNTALRNSLRVTNAPGKAYIAEGL